MSVIKTKIRYPKLEKNKNDRESWYISRFGDVSLLKEQNEKGKLLNMGLKDFTSV